MNPRSDDSTAIVLTNIGTPDALTVSAVRRYLAYFLSDKRVIQLPRLIWLPILYGFILTRRPKQSLQLYKKIWTDSGSPLLTSTMAVAKKLEQHLNLPVLVGMHYSQPTLFDTATFLLTNPTIKKIIFLPLYPQYSSTTTASAFDIVASAIKKQIKLPDIHFISSYAHYPVYIDAIKKSIEQFWFQNGRADHLLFSFHGLPESYSMANDPYEKQCHQTAQSIASALHLLEEQWTIAFQSRVGFTPWIKPYTDEILEQFPKKGIKHLHVVCPGFSVDCLETLEEIAIRGKEQFFSYGGESFHYIPALNDTDAHINMLMHILKNSYLTSL